MKRTFITLQGEHLLLLQHVLAAACLRIWVLGSVPQQLLRENPSVANAYTSSKGAQEGSFLGYAGLSPYAGSGCHIPPLMLLLQERLLGIPALQAACVIAADAVAAVHLYSLTRTLRSSVSGVQVAALYLWNPLTILSCTSGTAAPLTAAITSAAVRQAAEGRQLAASFCSAVAVYLMPHAAFLLVPLSVLVFRGPECLRMAVQPGSPSSVATHTLSSHVPTSPAGSLSEPPFSPRDQAQRKAAEHHTSVGVTNTAADTTEMNRDDTAADTTEMNRDDTIAASKAHSVHASAQKQVSYAHMQSKRVRLAVHNRAVCVYLSGVAVCFALLWMLSDLALKGMPEHVCGSWVEWVGLSRGVDCRILQEAGLRVERGSVRHWAVESFSFALMGPDITPNIGLSWYFLATGFQEYAFASHLLMLAVCGIVTLPLAAVLYHRPLLLIILQLIATSTFQPYPTLSEPALYLALLLLYAPHLSSMPSKFFMLQTFAVLMLLQPAMHHLWVDVGSGNPNFYFAVTFLYAAWQVLLFIQVLGAVIHHDSTSEGR